MRPAPQFTQPRSASRVERMTMPVPLRTLTTLTTPLRIGADLFEVEIPDGWHQGRGAFGGLVIGTLVRAITAFDAADSASPFSLRALTAELCAPVLPGPNRIRVERLRT